MISIPYTSSVEGIEPKCTMLVKKKKLCPLAVVFSVGQYTLIFYTFQDQFHLKENIILQAIIITVKYVFTEFVNTGILWYGNLTFAF